MDKKIYILFLLLFLLFSCEKLKDVASPPKNDVKKNEERYERQIEELKKAVKGDIKIKLKRDGKGNYTWEIQGRDVNEVLKANDILRKRLSE
jgi:translation initiation factor 1 (eIF-1/SUI1)